MEAKKNPMQDVHRQSFRFFLIGLGISSSLAITAFEWTTKNKKVTFTTGFEPALENTLDVLPTIHEIKPTTFIFEKKDPTFNSGIIPVSFPDILTDDNSEDVTNNDVPDINHGHISYDLPPEDTTQIFLLAEVQPKPVGGYDSFYAQLAKNLKYPRQAIRQGIDGKVFVEFIVDRNGKVVNLKIIKGIGAGCDEEAMRVIALTPWEPGKQRGKPVYVRMVMPVVFKVH